MSQPVLLDIANQLVAHCRAGTEREALASLYHTDAVSIEAADMGNGRETKGIDGIHGKHDWWDSAFDVHDAVTEGPFWHGDDRFAVIFKIDATERESGERSQMREVGIYTVENGKIVKEEFFYGV